MTDPLERILAAIEVVKGERHPEESFAATCARVYHDAWDTLSATDHRTLEFAGERFVAANGWPEEFRAMADADPTVAHAYVGFTEVAREAIDKIEEPFVHRLLLSNRRGAARNRIRQAFEQGHDDPRVH